VGKHKKRRGGGPNQSLARIPASDSGQTAPVHIGALRVGGARREIVIDMTKLASPPNAYDADVAWVEHSPGQPVVFYFGKLDRQGRGLKSRLALRYPPENFVTHFWKNSRAFHDGLREYVARWPSDAKRLALHPEEMDAQRDHSEWVNFDYMAHSGTEAGIDFFHIPPAGVARYAKNQGTAGLELLPRIRVQLTVQELLNLLEACAPIAEEVKEYMPTGETGENDKDTEPQP
jgi:hypothetical protein